ncbi:hypothetical protein DSUL_50231 [Desulfovibrionales bacterium]
MANYIRSYVLDDKSYSSSSSSANAMSINNYNPKEHKLQLLSQTDTKQLKRSIITKSMPDTTVEYIQYLPLILSAFNYERLCL